MRLGFIKARVEHFVIFEKLIFTITSKLSRIPKEHIEPKDFYSYHKNDFLEVAKCSTLESVPVKINLEIGEMTKYGWLIMPDCKNLTGPLYMAKLKVSE